MDEQEWQQVAGHEGNVEGGWLELQNGKVVKVSGRVDRIEGNFGPSYECMMIWAILTSFMKWRNTWFIFKDYDWGILVEVFSSLFSQYSPRNNM